MPGSEGRMASEGREGAKSDADRGRRDARMSIPTPAAALLREETWIRRAIRRVRKGLRTAGEIYEGIYFAPYRSQIYRSYREERDTFLLLGFADLLGAPNPVAFYALEVYPDVIEEFHQWHVRIGMPRSPDGGFRCC